MPRRDCRPGSTSYYFRTREALLRAAAVRLADLDLAAAARLPQPRTRDALLHALAGMVRAQSGEFRERTIARYQLSLEAGRYPEVHAALAAMAERFTAAAAELLGQLGARDPRRDARALIAACAGLVFESAVGGSHPTRPARSPSCSATCSPRGSGEESSRITPVLSAPISSTDVE